MTHDELLAYYATPGIFTAVSGFEDQIGAIPDDIASIAATVQGLLVHEALAPAYNLSLTPEQRAQKQLHSAEAMLTCATRTDSRPIAEARQPDQRTVGVCRHFATLFVAILRHKNIPARARCGFANYFEPGKNLDHWVGEYWNADEGRWILIDAQVDDLQRMIFTPNFDTLDVPRDRFLVAGDAWRLCREGGVDPMTFGVAGTENWGLIEVFGDLFQDLAALQKIELLPWGWYGLPTDNDNRNQDLALVDTLAQLALVADAAAIERVHQMLAADERLRVPPETLQSIIEREKALPA